MIGFYNYTVILTYVGLVSGVIGTFLALEGHPCLAVFCCMFCGFCDMFDGFVARKRKRTDLEKKFGIQIDSLCDLICFGFFPALISYSLGAKQGYQCAVLITYVLAALIRLAYFNVVEEERQSQTDEKRKFYEGLPVTSIAMLYPLIYMSRTIFKKYFLCALSLFMFIIAMLFVSKIKIKKPGIKGLMSLLAIGLIELVLLLLVK